jgi:hypothetical protein
MSRADQHGSSRIFISYRHQETAYAASWLYDRLSAEFGGAQVFKDVDNLRPGDDFFESIASAVVSCDVLLALIGANWAEATDGLGRRRIDDPADFVRLEVETALARDVRVIPLLIGDAQMPSREELPPSLAPLVRKHALELSPSHFNRDAEALVAALKEVLAEERSKSQIIVASPDPSRYSTQVKAHSSAQQGMERGPERSVRPPQPTPLSTRGNWIVDDNHPSPSGAKVVGSQQSALKRHLKWVVVGALILLLASGGIFASRIGARNSAAERSSEEVPRTQMADLPRSAKPLPDDSLVWRRERGGVYDISTIHINGTEGALLITGQENHGAILTPDRRTVLYLHENENRKNSFELHAMSADGRADRLLFSDGSQSCPILGQPAIRSDGVLAVPCREYIGGPFVLNLMSLDGSVIRLLDQGWLGDATFTNDGKSVIYWRAKSYHQQDGGALYKLPIAESAAPTPITDGDDSEDADPAFSPTSDEVVFRRVRGNRWMIAIIDQVSTGKGRIRTLPSSYSFNQRPSWSPDGSQIVYQHAKNSRTEATLLLANADGTGERPVKYNKGYSGPPSWTAR